MIIIESEHACSMTKRDEDCPPANLLPREHIHRKRHHRVSPYDGSVGSGGEDYHFETTNTNNIAHPLQVTDDATCC